MTGAGLTFEVGRAERVAERVAEIGARGGRALALLERAFPPQPALVEALEGLIDWARFCADVSDHVELVNARAVSVAPVLADLEALADGYEAHLVWIEAVALACAPPATARPQ